MSFLHFAAEHPACALLIAVFVAFYLAMAIVGFDDDHHEE